MNKCICNNLKYTKRVNILPHTKYFLSFDEIGYYLTPDSNQFKIYIDQCPICKRWFKDERHIK